MAATWSSRGERRVMRIWSRLEGVAVRVFEVGGLGVALERGDALLVGLQPRFVVVLEGDAPLGELVYDPLDIVDTPS